MSADGHYAKLTVKKSYCHMLYMRQATVGVDITTVTSFHIQNIRRIKQLPTRMWANAQRDGRPAEYRWRPLLNATKFG